MSQAAGSGAMGVVAAEGPLWRRAQDELARWLAEARALQRDARALRPLCSERAHSDLQKLAQLLDGIEAKLRRTEDGAPRGLAFVSELRTELARRSEVRRRELARELAEACRRRGLELGVVRREEPIEVRIPPFAVEIDRAKGRATLLFARLPVDQCAADAEPIADLVLRRRDAFELDFVPQDFFEACRSAWVAARALGLGGASERVELADFLPLLALRRQPRKFLQEPSARNFVDYPRTRFAYDLMQLRRAGLLALDGWRLNLGVATGTTASQKKRALFVEDERGQGEYKLTIFFTQA